MRIKEVSQSALFPGPLAEVFVNQNGNHDRLKQPRMPETR